MLRQKSTCDASDAPSVVALTEEEEDNIIFEKIREFAHQRLSAAVDEIFDFFQKNVSNYENNLEKYCTLLERILKPEIKLHRIDCKAPSESVNTTREATTGSEEEEDDDADEGDDDDDDNDNKNDEEDDADRDNHDDYDQEASGDDDDEDDDDIDENESDEEPADEDNEMDEEIQEIEAFQPELSMKKKPEMMVQTRMLKKKMSKPEASELLGRLKVALTKGAVDEGFYSIPVLHKNAKLVEN